MLGPVVDFLSRSTAPPGHNPLDNPSMLDSATVDPQELRLPTDDLGGETESSEVETCPECQKSFGGPHAVKNVR